jgi:uncharacterized repeat protein (TIGR01451 family)
MFPLTRRGFAAPVHESRHSAGRAVAALITAGLTVTALAAAPAAVAAVSATSPSGMVAITTPGPVLAGVATTYTLTVTNVGSQGASEEQAGVQLPAGMTLNHLDASCQRTNNPTLPGTAFSCGWLGVAAGQSVSATFTATVSGPNTYVDQVSAALDFGGIPPTSVSRDSVSYSIPAGAGPTDIQVTGSSNNGSPAVGSPFAYTFQVKDNGPQAAYGVAVDDVLPASITPFSVSADNGTCTLNASTNTVHCDIGLLGVGDQSRVVVNAVANAGGTATNIASIAMQGPDTKPANNSVGVTISPRSAG